MRKIVLLVSCILLICSQSESQDWVRMFTDGNFVDVTWVIQTYDKGYIILDNENPSGYIWLIKTDINGYSFGKKRSGLVNITLGFEISNRTQDGG